MLIFFSVFLQFLFLYGYWQMDRIQNRVWLTAEKNSEGIPAERVQELEDENARSREKMAFAAWREEREEVFSEELRQTQNTEILICSKRADLLVTGSRVFEETKPMKCQISTGLAREIFGSEQVVGLSVQCLGENYQIMNVFPEKELLLLCFPGYSVEERFTEFTIWNSDRKSPKLQKERFEEKTGVQVRYMDFGFLPVVCEGSFFLLTGIFSLWSLRKRYRDIRSLEAVLLLLSSIFVLLHFRGIPADFLPTKMSDVEFWRNLLVEEKNNFVYLLRKEWAYPVLSWYKGGFLAITGLFLYIGVLVLNVRGMEQGK